MIRALCPWWRTSRDDYRLSGFVKLYLMAETLGMLARYFPSKSMVLVRNKEGSVAQPLLAKATSSIETEFIREFAEQVAVIANERYFFGAHFGYSATLCGGDWRDGWRTSETNARTRSSAVLARSSVTVN